MCRQGLACGNLGKRYADEFAKRNTEVLAVSRAKENGEMSRKLGMLVAMLIAPGTIGIGANSASAAGVQVPFSASYSGTAATNLTFSGTGTSTHLGRISGEGYAVVTGPASSCLGGFANTNYQTLTAANGDSLTLTSSDVACPIDQGVYRGTGQYVVTGGTGRFSGATGQGTFDGRVDFTQGVSSFQLTGTISAPTGA
ncbi:MAG: hypothetical protein M3R02_24630 [Chloroflexota bacterium]|nr:hypothetical protein [Chloroflexota bacterium]